MALQLPAGVLKPSLFDAGDSMIKSTKRLAAFLEAFSILDEAIASYNTKNTSVPVPPSNSSYNDDDNTATQSVAIAYRKVGNTKVARDYIGEEVGWTIPTTGELAGKESLLDAIVYMAEQIAYFAGELRTNIIINSAKGLVNLDDNNANSEYTLSSTLPFNTIRLSDGGIQKRAQNWLLLLDEQEGL